MPVRAIDPVCPQTVLPMGGNAVPIRMLCVTNIPSVNGNDTLFCADLKGKRTVESFRSLRFTVFDICSCKVENCGFCENLTFDLL